MKYNYIIFNDFLEFLRFPEVKYSSITETTPQINFVKKHLGDIKKETNALYWLLHKNKQIKPSHVYDLMAGGGFSSMIFKHCYKGVSLTLNDLDEYSCNVLRFNFPNCQVYNSSIVDWKEFLSKSLVFADFNNFTLNKEIDAYSKTFENVKEIDWFIFTDSYSYCAKFKNGFTFDYYKDLKKYVKEKSNLYLNTIVIFGNAALCLCEKKEKDLQIHKHSSPLLSIELSQTIQNTII